ncbi:hypothetical protein [Trebonia sp.]|uniref:hypothetical protein n=1 Tax=Trebonia sp. TaxID=2767075 RepID=UPI002617ECAD|nr:hypothetical protein [Trebonia sp.]
MPSAVRASASPGAPYSRTGDIHAWNVRPRPYLEAVSDQQPQPVKYRPWIGTTHPMTLPVPALVGITDTNALASRACNAARSSVAENLFTGLATTGRSNTYVSAHVPGELVRHLADVAEGHPGLDLRDAERVLWGDIMPLVPVVDLAMGDYLHPRIRAVRQADPELPLRLRGDPDDLGTAALAEFLAPAVIISADSVFSRFGLANSLAGTWLPLAHQLLQAAGYEATLTEAAYALELAARLIAVPVTAAIGTARRHPLAALGIGAAIALVAYQAGYFRRDRLRAASQEIRRVAAAGIEALSDATDAYSTARQALRIIEPYGTPTVEELAARHLARVRRPLPLDDLAAALAAAGHTVTSTELRDSTDRHPAFRTRGSQPALISVGRIARPGKAESYPQVIVVTITQRS